MPASIVSKRRDVANEVELDATLGYVVTLLLVIIAIGTAWFIGPYLLTSVYTSLARY